jgi:hypothetical protein
VVVVADLDQVQLEQQDRGQVSMVIIVVHKVRPIFIRILLLQPLFPMVLYMANLMVMAGITVIIFLRLLQVVLQDLLQQVIKDQLLLQRLLQQLLLLIIFINNNQVEVVVVVILS